MDLTVIKRRVNSLYLTGFKHAFKAYLRDICEMLIAISQSLSRLFKVLLNDICLQINNVEDDCLTDIQRPLFKGYSAVI